MALRCQFGDMLCLWQHGSNSRRTSHLTYLFPCSPVIELVPDTNPPVISADQGSVLKPIPTMRTAHMKGRCKHELDFLSWVPVSNTK
jgi:hypothetical protein